VTLRFGARRLTGLLGGLLLFVAILVAPPPAGMSLAAQRMAAVAALMACWWITEATHISVTALIPLAAYPLLGIMPSTEVAPHYANHLIFLYVGGFVIALAMEKWNLHRRVALATIAAIGTRPQRLVLGFMIATAGVSMWVSNTATTMMMLPVAMAVVNQIAESALVDGARDADTPDRVKTTFGRALLLAVAYSASIGGVGTIVGTPTNVAFLGFAAEHFPDRPQISFLEWSLVAVPVVAVYLPLAWLYLCRFGAGIPLRRIHFTATHSVIEEERKRLGPMSAPEKAVVAVASATALLWIFRRPIRIGALAVPGWSAWFAHSEFPHDATVAVAAAILLCLIPVNLRGGLEWKGRWERFVMEWNTIERGLPWGVVLLFGGGFAMAAGMEKSGLAAWFGQLLAGLKGAPVWILFPAACILAVLLTEMTSNVATVLMISPVLAEAAVQFGVNPYLLLFPATIMASFAFMLPVATPPNAVVFSSGWITIPAMFRAGAALDALALLVVPVLVYVLGAAVFRF
jgi:sodium-dependent dicarboxylate transporter 2/3/5